jgi:hypothetical protein
MMQFEVLYYCWYSVSQPPFTQNVLFINSILHTTQIIEPTLRIIHQELYLIKQS